MNETIFETMHRRPLRDGPIHCVSPDSSRFKTLCDNWVADLPPSHNVMSALDFEHCVTRSIGKACETCRIATRVRPRS